MFTIVDAAKGTIVIDNIGGSSAANMLGRFSHADEDIAGIVKEVAGFEQDMFPNSIVAEIVHLPQDRVGNVLLRTRFRNSEIAYLGKANQASQSLSVKDLFVSIRDGRIILRSAGMDREIIPRLSTAHNYRANSLPVYKFLCDLQLQGIGTPGFSFSWGALGKAFKFLPRAMYKDIILKPATWNLVKSDLETLLAARNISDWRKRWNMPRYITLKEGDNDLLVDLESDLSVEIFAQAVKKKQSITIAEFLYNPSCSLVKNGDNLPFNHEIVAIILNDGFNPKQYQPTRSKVNIQRDFEPGSEWVYYKLYCGIKVGDILLAHISTLIQSLRRNQTIKRWFFIRYQDPDPHIRIRVELNKVDDYQNVNNRFREVFNKFKQDGYLRKIVLDTYSREIERYGGASMLIVESIFMLDSDSVAGLLSQLLEKEDSNVRFEFALKSLDDLLECFHLDNQQRLAWLRKVRDSYFLEHGGNKHLKLRLDQKYRSLRSRVKYINDTSLSEINWENILAVRKQGLEKLTGALRGLSRDNKLEVSMEDLLTSLAHMCINRIFSARQRTCELVIYDFLYRHYKSIIARDRVKL
jgi:thiopeptide-type bacteriocin biosynthesis protein